MKNKSPLESSESIDDKDPVGNLLQDQASDVSSGKPVPIEVNASEDNQTQIIALQKKMVAKRLLLVGIILSLFTVLGVTYLFASQASILTNLLSQQRLSGVIPDAPTPAPSPSPTAVASPSPTPDPRLGWISFRFEQGGFSLRSPREPVSGIEDINQITDQLIVFEQGPFLFLPNQMARCDDGKRNTAMPCILSGRDFAQTQAIEPIEIENNSLLSYYVFVPATSATIRVIQNPPDPSLEIDEMIASYDTPTFQIAMKVGDFTAAEQFKLILSTITFGEAQPVSEFKNISLPADRVFRDELLGYFVVVPPNWKVLSNLSEDRLERSSILLPEDCPKTDGAHPIFRDNSGIVCSAIALPRYYGNGWGYGYGNLEQTQEEASISGKLVVKKSFTYENDVLFSLDFTGEMPQESDQYAQKLMLFARFYFDLSPKYEETLAQVVNSLEFIAN